MTSRGLSEEFHDPRHKALIEKFINTVGERYGSTTTWAFLWLGDIEKLDAMIDGLRIPASGITSVEDLHVAELYRPPTPSSTAKNRVSFPSILCLTNNSQCRTRDRKTCIITGIPEMADGYHIYPSHLAPDLDSTAKVPHFWSILLPYWNADRVKAWEGQLFPTGNKIVSNYVCRSPNARSYWDSARFALKPLKLSEDKKRLEIQFCWTPKYKFQKKQDL
jgi:hypothetical protein